MFGQFGPPKEKNTTPCFHLSSPSQLKIHKHTQTKGELKNSSARPLLTITKKLTRNRNQTRSPSPSARQVCWIFTHACVSHTSVPKIRLNSALINDGYSDRLQVTLNLTHLTPLTATAGVVAEAGGGQGLGDGSVETQGDLLQSPNRCRRPGSIATYGPESSLLLDMKLHWLRLHHAHFWFDTWRHAAWRHVVLIKFTILILCPQQTLPLK